MERFSQRDSVLLGYSPQKTFTNNHPGSSPDNPDIDFNDVFGGPPRRASVQETRRSFGENDPDSYALTTTSHHRHRWSGLSEKPVFGDENANRRRYPSQDFFDDIFNGNESLSSSPRKTDRDSFSLHPGSRVLSPACPLPPRAAEPFASSSLPSQFSLPAKLIKGTDLPSFGSTTRNHHKNKDGNSGFYAESPLSRFSVQANQVRKEPRSDVHVEGSLSRELSVSSLESASLVEPDEMRKSSSSNKASKISESSNSNQFHFSIYKWAGKGVPLALPLRKSKEWVKFERSSSASGRIGCEGVKGLPTKNSRDRTLRSFSDDILSDAKSSEIEFDKKDNGSLPITSTGKFEQKQFVEETVLPESDQTIGQDIFQDPKEKTKNHSVTGESKFGKLQVKNPVVKDETPKAQLKTLRSLMSGTDGIPTKNETRERKVKSTKKSAAIFNVSEKEKKQDGETTVSRNSQDGFARDQARGKVKEFVKIFSQEASNKPMFNVDSQSRSSTRKERRKLKPEDDPSVTKAEIAEKVRLPNGNKNHKPEASVKVQFEKQNLDTGTNCQKATDISSASILDVSEVIGGDRVDSFRGNILIKELSQDEDEFPQASENQVDFLVIHAKIRKWSNGKEGNIRSLLSTLQYVLWPESGWKPVPLVDIIEGNAVKRSYQKALLSLHPDKLQQKGATSHQKYIAEKVFDILQEAWTHFSSLGSA